MDSLERWPAIVYGNYVKVINRAGIDGIDILKPYELSASSRGTWESIRLYGCEGAERKRALRLLCAITVDEIFALKSHPVLNGNTATR